MPIRKRGAAWEVTVCHHGQVVRRSSKNWSKAQARQVERKILDDLITIENGGQPERTLYDALERFVKEDLPRLKSQKETRSKLALCAPFMDGRTIMQAPAAADDMKWAWEHLAVATINIRLRTFKSVVGRCFKKWEWIDTPIHSRISLVPGEKERHIYLEPSEVFALAELMPRTGGYVVLAAYTGIRKGQLLGLNSSHVRGDCIWLGTEGKTSRPQVIPVHHKAQAFLDGLPFGDDNLLRREWDAARAQLGLSHYRFHDLRHTAASWLLQAGADLQTVRDLLGHSTITMTQRYAHLRTEHLRKAVGAIK